MKILKFSGIVVGVHLFALILIFANPGCSSSTKPASPASDTATSDVPPTITVPSGSTASTDSGGASATAPIAFNPESSVRYSPTRPGTPAASTLQVEPVNNVIPATTYTVVSGDNLSVIAKKNHTTVAELAGVNNLNAATAKLHPGQKLIIPGKMAAPAKTNEVSASPGFPASTPDAAASPKTGTEGLFKHPVKSGENLSTIAKKYGVKPGEIAVANNISDPQKIRAGMVLLIPGWKSTDGKPVRSQKTNTADTSARRDYESAPATTAVTEPSPDSSARPPAGEVPVIQVEEAPAPAK